MDLSDWLQQCDSSEEEDGPMTGACWTLLVLVDPAYQRPVMRLGQAQSSSSQVRTTALL